MIRVIFREIIPLFTVLWIPGAVMSSSIGHFSLSLRKLISEQTPFIRTDMIDETFRLILVLQKEKSLRLATVFYSL